MNPDLKRRFFLKSTASVVAGYLASSCSQSSLSDINNTFPEDVYTQNNIVDQAAVDATLDNCAAALAQKKKVYTSLGNNISETFPKVMAGGQGCD